MQIWCKATTQEKDLSNLCYTINGVEDQRRKPCFLSWVEKGRNERILKILKKKIGLQVVKRELHYTENKMHREPFDPRHAFGR